MHGSLCTTAVQWSSLGLLLNHWTTSLCSEDTLQPVVYILTSSIADYTLPLPNLSMCAYLQSMHRACLHLNIATTWISPPPTPPPPPTLPSRTISTGKKRPCYTVFDTTLECSPTKQNTSPDHNKLQSNTQGVTWFIHGSSTAKKSWNSQIKLLSMTWRWGWSADILCWHL